MHVEFLSVIPGAKQPTHCLSLPHNHWGVPSNPGVCSPGSGNAQLEGLFSHGSPKAAKRQELWTLGL